MSRKSEKIVDIIDDKSRFFSGYNFDDIAKKRTLILSSINPYTINMNVFSHHFNSFGYTSEARELWTSYSYEATSYSFQEDSFPMFSTQLYQIKNNIPCHTFQLEKSKAFQTEEIDSLNFNLQFNYDSYQFFDPYFYYKSIFLYITNQNELPQLEEIILQPEFKHVITLSQIRYQYKGLKKPCRESIYQMDLYDALFQSTKVFEGGYKDCRKITKQELFYENCNCFSPFLPIYRNESGSPKLCLNMTIFTHEELVANANCLYRISKNRYKDYIDRKCNHLKLPKCDQIVYKIEHERYNYLQSKRTNTVQRVYEIYSNCQNISERFCGKYYFDLVVQQTSNFGDLVKEDLQYPFPQLLSDIGGLMGLWLGMSIIGVFEIVEFIYLHVLERYNKNKPLDDGETINLA